MFSIITAEIRWFIQGSAYGMVHAWLKVLDGLYQEELPRTDLYLIFPGGHDLGVKLRQGKIELKKKLAHHGQYDHEANAGRIESWIKWSINGEEGLSPDNNFFGDPTHWLPIQKTRFLQKYAISGDQLILPPRAGFPEKGIAVELSAVKVLGQDWWTFGLECFGNTGDIHTDLMKLLPRLTIGFPAGMLAAERSMGYPEWIGQLIKKP
jgi:hypothetical protein